jgi:hypothetical protein
MAKYILIKKIGLQQFQREGSTRNSKNPTEKHTSSRERTKRSSN